MKKEISTIALLTILLVKVGSSLEKVGFNEVCKVVSRRVHAQQPSILLTETETESQAEREARLEKLPNFDLHQDHSDLEEKYKESWPDLKANYYFQYQLANSDLNGNDVVARGKTSIENHMQGRFAFVPKTLKRFQKQKSFKDEKVSLDHNNNLHSQTPRRRRSPIQDDSYRDDQTNAFSITDESPSTSVFSPSPTFHTSTAGGPIEKEYSITITSASQITTDGDNIESTTSRISEGLNTRNFTSGSTTMENFEGSSLTTATDSETTGTGKSHNEFTHATGSTEQSITVDMNTLSSTSSSLYEKADKSLFDNMENTVSTLQTTPPTEYANKNSTQTSESLDSLDTEGERESQPVSDFTVEIDSFTSTGSSIEHAPGIHTTISGNFVSESLNTTESTTYSYSMSNNESSLQNISTTMPSPTLTSSNTPTLTAGTDMSMVTLSNETVGTTEVSTSILDNTTFTANAENNNEASTSTTVSASSIETMMTSETPVLEESSNISTIDYQTMNNDSLQNGSDVSGHRESNSMGIENSTSFTAVEDADADTSGYKNVSTIPYTTKPDVVPEKNENDTLQFSNFTDLDTSTFPNNMSQADQANIEIDESTILQTPSPTITPGLDDSSLSTIPNLMQDVSSLDPVGSTSSAHASSLPKDPTGLSSEMTTQSTNSVTVQQSQLSTDTEKVEPITVLIDPSTALFESSMIASSMSPEDAYNSGGTPPTFDASAQEQTPPDVSNIGETQSPADLSTATKETTTAETLTSSPNGATSSATEASTAAITVSNDTPAPTEAVTPGPTEAVTPGPTEAATPAPTEAVTPAPNEAVTPAPTEAATPAPTEAVTPAANEPVTIAPTEAATPAPTEAATPAPTETITSALTEAITPAPTEAVTPAPTEANTSAPTEAVTPASTEAVTPAPTEAVTPAPTEAVTLAPTEAATPAPTDASTPASTEAITSAPTEAITPAPTEAITSARTEVVTPVPTEAITPVPTEAITPAATEAATPAPTEAVTPAPTEAITPVPTEAATPAPTEAATQPVTPPQTEAPTPIPAEPSTEAPTPAPTLANFLTSLTTMTSNPEQNQTPNPMDSLICDDNLWLECDSKTTRCKCKTDMIYDTERNLCVSLVEKTCQLGRGEAGGEILCVKNAECSEKEIGQQGKCKCKKGFLPTNEGLCLPGLNMTCSSNSTQPCHPDLKCSSENGMMQCTCQNGLSPGKPGTHECYLSYNASCTLENNRCNSFAFLNCSESTKECKCQTEKNLLYDENAKVCVSISGRQCNMKEDIEGRVLGCVKNANCKKSSTASSGGGDDDDGKGTCECKPEFDNDWRGNCLEKNGAIKVHASVIPPILVLSLSFHSVSLVNQFKMY